MLLSDFTTGGIMDTQSITTLAQAGMSAVGIKVLYDLAGPSLKVAGSLLADRIYFWQWENRVKLGEQFKKVCEERHLEISSVPTEFLMPILDAVGNVENDDLQNLWASLLASGMSNEDNRHPRFVQILSALSPNDAILLKRIASTVVRSRTWQKGLRITGDERLLLSTLRQTDVSLGNLHSLGLIGQTRSYINEKDVKVYKAKTKSELQIRYPLITVLGCEFCLATLGFDPIAKAKELKEKDREENPVTAEKIAENVARNAEEFKARQAANEKPTEVANKEKQTRSKSKKRKKKKK